MAVAVVQLAEQSLPTPEDWGSNTVISNLNKVLLFTVNWKEATEIKKNKRPVSEGPIKQCEKHVTFDVIFSKMSSALGKALT